MVANAFLIYCIVPCILPSFTMVNKGTMSLNFTIFVLYQIISAVNDPEFTNCLIGLILRPKIHVKFDEMMSGPVLDPQEYALLWSQPKKPSYNYNLIKHQ